MSPFVRCGSCSPCRLFRQMEWRSRLYLEAATNPAWPLFLTLTYKPSTLPADAEGCVHEVQKFVKRLRKCGPVRYLMAVEQGSATKRLHHHGILWYTPPMRSNLEILKHLLAKWPQGRLDWSYCRTKGSMRYVVKYITKGGAYSWSSRPVLGAHGVRRWARHVLARHDETPYLEPRDVPAFINCTVLGRPVVVRIPETDLDRMYLELGVRSTRYDDVYQGVPTAPVLDLRSELEHAKTDTQSEALRSDYLAEQHGVAHAS